MHRLSPQIEITMLQPEVSPGKSCWPGVNGGVFALFSSSIRCMQIRFARGKFGLAVPPGRSATLPVTRITSRTADA